LSRDKGAVVSSAEENVIEDDAVADDLKNI